MTLRFLNLAHAQLHYGAYRRLTSQPTSPLPSGRTTPLPGRLPGRVVWLRPQVR
ncbi:hypothetical protein [Marinobacter xestospongiae]|uniref:Uncharacterized protein n=1 Tax=Marinobacter xestospongiae TaxID=994319 RepID=A0ABU3W2Q6_9GAMM|nr:hypothetical protein [Marinobacter xestospongiae]MDV2080827.1 hypothetical protein [Marinobacter xestospongiae]